MAKVVVLAKRRAWRDLKRAMKSGRAIAPRVELPKKPQPMTDAGLAFAYMAEAIKKNLR